MAVPQKIVGAWRRSGLLLDGVRHVDHADVIWLQTPEWYADIRLRIDPKSVVPTDGVPDWFAAEFSFAGPAEWNDPVITWNHAIDMSLEPAVDANPLTWEDGVAFERGTTEVDGTPTPFIEEWLRMTDDDVTWSADIGDKEARIEVGRFAIEIRDQRGTGGAFTSTRFHLVDGDWVEFGSVSA
jgi:hypothetical protein